MQRTTISCGHWQRLRRATLIGAATCLFVTVSPGYWNSPVQAAAGCCVYLIEAPSGFDICSNRVEYECSSTWGYSWCTYQSRKEGPYLYIECFNTAEEEDACEGNQTIVQDASGVWHWTEEAYMRGCEDILQCIDPGEYWGSFQLLTGSGTCPPDPFSPGFTCSLEDGDPCTFFEPECLESCQEAGCCDD